MENTIRDFSSGVGGFLSQIVNYLNPFSDSFILKQLGNFVGTILDYLNPFSENFILTRIINFLAELISYINPFSENFFVYKLINLLSDLFNLLFVPSNNPFESLSNKFNEKFAFINQIKDLISNLLGFSNYGDSVPTFNVSLFGLTIGIIDFSLFINYRLWIHGIILAIAWVTFILKLHRKLPGVIGGGVE